MILGEVARGSHLHLSMIEKISLEEVQSYNFILDPHTVSLKDNGEWWGFKIDGRVISVLCVSDKHGGKYFSENYTDPEYRGQGYFTKLLDYVSNQVYKDYKCIAHCLKSSKNCYERCGYTHYKTREFKYGTQYFMIKNVVHTYSKR